MIYLLKEHFYDRTTNTGFIEFRLKTLRHKLPSNDKKRAASVQLGNEEKLTKYAESLLDEKNFKLKVNIRLKNFFTISLKFIYS